MVYIDLYYNLYIVINLINLCFNIDMHHWSDPHHLVWSQFRKRGQHPLENWRLSDKVTTN